VTERVAQNAHLLLVDDEPQITRVLRTACSAHGYTVDVADDGHSALDAFEKLRPDLVVTDLSMPGMSGVELCRAIRNRSTVPIIVLSVRDQEKVKVQALDAGADDYVTKPFQMEELLARIRSALRRSAYPPEEPAPARIEAGDFVVDRERLQVWVRGVEIHLTPKEFSLLLVLSQNPDRVMTHRALLRAVWGAASGDHPETLRVLIGQLRRKIETAGGPPYIVTEPWTGYRFLPGGATQSAL
jgi:two-component system KDP operon response regulator KdpE